MRLVAFFLLAALVGAVGTACGTEEIVDCFPTGLFINAEKGAVQEVLVSGPACATAKVDCISERTENNVFAPGCENYLVSADRAGTCHIDVHTSDGRVFSADFDIVESCSGFYPKGDGVLTIPPRDAGVRDGADDVANDVAADAS